LDAVDDATAELKLSPKMDASRFPDAKSGCTGYDVLNWLRNNDPKEGDVDEPIAFSPTWRNPKYSARAHQ
jgi:hypothetical protein